MPVNFISFYLIGIAATLLASGAVYFFSRHSRREAPTWLFWTLIGASGYLFFAQYFKYQSLHFYVDFTHWLQLLNTISQTGLPYALNQEFITPGTLNYFAAHFVPLIYILAILFKLIPRPETVIVLNVTLMISSAIPLYKLALHHFVPPLRVRGGEEGLRSYQAHLFGLFIVALFLWYPTFQYITLYEFEMLRFSIPILLWMLYFFETRRTILYFIFVFLAILVREEMGLTVTMFGVYAFFFAKRRKEGLFAIVLGLGGFALIGNVIMPMLRDGQYAHISAGEFKRFGSSPLEILGGILRHPVLLFQAIIYPPLKFANFFMFGLPLLFISLVAPTALLGAVANVGTALIGSVIYSSYMLYYIAPSVPFMFYAFLKAWPKVAVWFNVIGLSYAVFVAVIFSNIFFGPSPISLQFWFKNIRPAPFRTENFHWSAYHVTDHSRKVEDFVHMIPDNAVVSAPQFLHPWLYKKKGTMIFPKLKSKDGEWQAGYVFLDTTNNGLKPESPAYVTQKETALVRENDEWELVKSDDGYELYRRHLIPDN